jgi:16S rRNA (guanine966-N2)-methyltransferase
VAGVEVADLCCGAGGLGIEALSRGANFVHFVDRAAPVLRQVAANLARCEADPASYRLVRGGAEGWLAGCHGRDFVRPLIVLADPPYGSDLAARLVAGLGALPPTVPLLVAVIEHAPRETPALAASVALGCRHKRYGNTALTILEA